MAGKVVNSSFVLLSKFVLGGQESASKTATSHIRETLAFIAELTQIQKNMNKIRIIGLIILIVGIIIQFTLENDATDFISGLSIGGGIGLLLTGKIGKPAIK